jgi:uncharacterized cupin superfamily protein
MIRPPEHWPVWRQEELVRNLMNGRVGSRMVSETNDVRVWTIDLAPGERLPFHRHVLNYFWVALCEGKTCSHFLDGTVQESIVKAGDARHYQFRKGEFAIHDLENTSLERMRFITVELKVGSENAPLRL